MLKYLLILFASIFGGSEAYADITTPIYGDDTSEPPTDPQDGRRRMPPMMQWCTIDTDARTVTTTLSVPVLTLPSHYGAPKGYRLGGTPRVSVGERGTILPITLRVEDADGGSSTRRWAA